MTSLVKKNYSKKEVAKDLELLCDLFDDVTEQASAMSLFFGCAFNKDGSVSHLFLCDEQAFENMYALEEVFVFNSINPELN